MNTDALGDRMKLYENAECARRFMPMLPVMARVDGRAFHSFTRGMLRPFDPDMTRCMNMTASLLAAETGAAMAYTQSDEITLVWHSTSLTSQIWFDGRITKMTSQLASQATVIFNHIIPNEWSLRHPTFDARVWNVPNRTEAVNCFLWREMDATKNSISMAAHAHFSDKQLHGLNGSQKQELLFQKGINWNDYPASFKRGTYIQRRKQLIKFTTAELDKLPPKHAARTNPDLMVERSVIRQIEMPIITTVTNREAVIFEGAEPVTF